MIAYFTKMYQAMPAIMQLYKALGGTVVSTRTSTIRAVRKAYPGTDVRKLNQRFRSLSAGHTAMQQADLIVTGSPYRSVLKHYVAKKCMIFHGTFAYLTPQVVQNFAHFDTLCAIGPRMQRILARSGIRAEIKTAGYLPFLEYPQKDAAVRKAALEAVGLDPARKTVVYLPSGAPHGSFDLITPRLLHDMADHTLNVIIRPHPSQAVKLNLRDRWKFWKLQRLIRRQGSVYLDLNDFKLSSLLSIADLVMSDGSSPAEESLYYDVPQIFVETDRFSPATIRDIMQRNNASEEDIDLTLNLFSCGPILDLRQPSLLPAIHDALENTGRYADNRDEYFRFVFGERSFKLQSQLIADLRQFST